MWRSTAASTAQVESAVRYFEYYVGMADKIDGDTIPLDGGTEMLDYTVREPLGVTGHIVPWNSTIVVPARRIAPALVAGNTVVAKASGEAPLSLLELAGIATEARLPDGVFNAVAGLDGTAGKRLVADDRTESIDFTGSTETGRDVMRSAADTLSPVHLELGGKSPNIVFPDADLETAARDSVKAFWNAEQTCFAPTRIFVHEDVDDDAPISREEVFGPVLTLYSFGSEEEAIRRANDTEYGLYALAWTNDLARAHRLVDRLEAGTVLINNYFFAFPLAPSGGYKDSGIGRD